jgi:hypothetical protein
MPTDCLESPPAIEQDPVGQVVFAKTTNGGSFGFIIARGQEKSRIFWHSDFCVEGPPEPGDLVRFRLAPPRRPGEAPRAKDVLVIAKAEKTKE